MEMEVRGTEEQEINISPELQQKVEIAIRRIKSFCPREGYFLAFSGGKDSITIKKLADLAGVKYDAHYNITTVDPPELVKYIRQNHSDVIFDHPKYSMRELIIRRKMPPTRLARYCCQYLKEVNGKGRVTMTGVRWAESYNRKTSQDLVSFPGRYHKRMQKKLDARKIDYQVNSRGGGYS